MAGVGAERWVRMCLGREAAWHARQQLLTLFSSSGGTLPLQGLAASTEEAGGSGKRVSGGGNGASGSCAPLWGS